MKYFFAFIFVALVNVPNGLHAKELGEVRHYVAIEVKPEEMPDCEAVDCDALFQSTIEIIEARFGGLGGPALRRIAYEGDARIGMVVAGKEHLETVRAVIGITDLQFLLVNEDFVPDQVDQLAVPKGTLVLPIQNPEYEGSIAVYSSGGIDGDHIAQARPGFDSYTNMPVVNIQFDEEGRRKFAALTTANVGKRFAIVLEGKVLSALYINEPILGGEAQISASRSQAVTGELAIAINGGALPAPFVIVEERKLNE